MKIYEIDAPSWEKYSRVPYNLNAANKWGLPGIKCDKCCSTWSVTGLEYPDIQLEIFKKEKEFSKPCVVSNARYNELLEMVKKELGKDLLIMPGTDFGPSKGILRGKPFDFLLSVRWTIVVRESVLRVFELDGIRGIIPVKPELKKTGKMQAEEYYELAVYPYAQMPEKIRKEIIKKRCDLCGREEFTVPERLIISEKTTPGDLDIFRGRDVTTYIFVTERFKEVVEKHGFTGAEFKPVEVE